MTTPGGIGANESLSCACVGPPGGKQKIECTLTAKPIVRLHPNHELMDGYWNGQPIAVKQHEFNHHKVFLNIYVPSYEHLVSPYEADECCNCEELLSELMVKFTKLKSLLHRWEWHQEYSSGILQKQPALDYGTSKKILALKDRSKTPCK
jgi:hypothetical protein